MSAAEFHFDVGSPNAYLCHAVLPAIEQRTGVKFTYVPVLLGGIFKATGNRSPIEAFAAVPAKLAYMRTEMARFIAAHGLTRYRPNPHFPVNTLAAMRVAVAAERAGCLAPYVDAAFAAMWERGQKLDELEVLRATLDEAGLDAAALLEQAQAPAVKQALADNTAASVARGCFGAPTFFVGQEMFFGKDRLAEVEAEIGRQRLSP